MEPACFRHPDKPGKYYCSKYNRYLCDDCLKCQDPSLYCKYRKMCFIWEVTKHGTPDMQEKAALAKKAELEPEKERVVECCEITFMPSNKTIKVDIGTTVLEAARKADVYINARCGGKGVCGSCKVKLEKGNIELKDSILLSEEDKKKGFILACTAEIKGSTIIKVPDENISRALKIVQDGSRVKDQLLKEHQLKPLVSVVPLELKPPSLDDPSSDLERTRHALSLVGFKNEYISISLPILRELSAILRESQWKINIVLLHYGATHEIVKISAYNPLYEIYGLAVDMGTTSVVAYLVDLKSGEVIGSTSTQNRQVVCGEDVISRIICAKGEDGLQKFHDYAISTINSLIEELIAVTHIKNEDILSFALSGNTVMTQSVLKLDPSSIRTEPYVPVGVEFPVFHAKNIGVNIYPQAGIFIVPGNAAYVGGDITAGILTSGLNKREENTLFIDVGTNGEMVLGNKDWMMTASCSAGPAFEGGGIRHGMRALPGAIDKVDIDPVTFDVKVGIVDNHLPTGICGSGMISLIGSLFLTGLLESSGKFTDKSLTDRIRTGKFGKEFVVSWEKDSAIEEDIVITEVDITTLLQSKAAVYAGIMTLLKSAGMELKMIDHIQLAGGFGRYIDFEKAIILGMLPDVNINKFEYLGNSSISGAYLALVSEDARNQLLKISRAMTYIDFSSSNIFYDEYIQALFLPHTDVQSFPSVMNKLNTSKNGNK